MLCEARYIIKLPNIAARRQYLEIVGRKRGEVAKKELEAEVLAEWERQKAKR